MKNRQYPLYEIPRIRDLKEMLALKQQAMPERAAFAFDDGQGHTIEKTYADFYRDVNALGTMIAMHGLSGIHIGIIGENSYQWLAAFLAVVNGGNVAVPIDKELPGKEITALLEKADVKVVFISKACEKKLKGIWGVKMIPMEEIETLSTDGQAVMYAGNREYLDFVPDTDKPCCILFTSGTSGASKGVMLSHRNMATDINESSRLVVLNGSTVSLLPYHHAFGLVVGVFMVFHYGFTVYINKNLRTIPRSLRSARPQNLFLVPLYVETFHRQIWATAKKEGKERLLKSMVKASNALLRVGIDLRKPLFPSVRKAFGGKLEYIICGGASLEEKYVAEFRSFGVEILNGYGTTECSPCAAVNRNLYHRDGTVGLPIPETEVQIARDGEVLIKGRHVMLGYYKEEEATAAVIRDGWYATGDLGFLDKDGFLTLLGRKKNLIILSNGENVSPEELEKDFLNDEAVREVLVYEEDGVITAEIYPEEEFTEKQCRDKQLQETYFQSLLKQVNQKKPSYKRVARIKLRDTEFPKNRSKKIIRYKVQGGNGT